MFSVKNPKTGGFELVPCGHCVGCLADMQAEWATRLTIEFEYNKQRPAVFFTLTYNDENLPTEECNKDGVMYEAPSVVPHHVEQFMRNLRNLRNRRIKAKKYKGYKGSLKYFITSEYGPEGGRPHYHGILFGMRNDSDTHDLIEQAWGKGFIHCAELTPSRIVYVTKYCTKPVEHQRNTERIGYFDEERWLDEDCAYRRRCFRRMSIGIGSEYCKDRANLKFHFRDIVGHNYIRSGKYKKRMPRYIKNKIYNDFNGELYCKNYRQKLAKITNEIHKKEKDYGKPYYYYSIDTAIGRSQYYRHLADAIRTAQIDEGSLARDIEDARTRENTLIQNYRRFLNRPGRYHRQ